ncbi:MAG: hypothetical protein V4590_13460 [Bacteroidota bacterium]
MKKLNYLMLMLLGVCYINSSFGQSTTDPDSVCAGATGKIYSVIPTPGSTYQWIVNGGTQASGGTSDSITINWSATAGTDTLKVVEYNAIGCPGDTIKLAVVRLPLPTVALSGTDSICINSATTSFNLTMTFTGVSPWDVSYTEDGTTRTVSTSSNPYTFNSQVYTASGVKSYSINSVTSRLGCVGTNSGSAAVTVFPKPSTSAIRHY